MNKGFLLLFFKKEGLPSFHLYAASAITPSASAPTTRARTTLPGTAAPTSRTGANRSQCPAVAVSASTQASRPTIPANNPAAAARPAARSRAARSRRANTGTGGIRAAGVPGRSL
jgi:hypothetical protein